MFPFAALLTACCYLLLCCCVAQAEEAITWHDATSLEVEGKGWDDTESYFDRLPARALGEVNDSIKGLAKFSTGMAVRFTTDSETLRVRWSLGDPNYVMTHMAATGTSGLDLYRKMPDGGWAYMGTGRPEGRQENEWTAFAKLPEQDRTFLLYLPLFNRVTALSIGLAPNASFEIIPGGRGETVVFYGTSIVNGGCASRPGMAYPAIIGRALDCATVNLGFSGSARMEPVICDLLAELDPAAYVIDALPNMYGEPITEKTLNLVRTIRKRHPATPIALVENITYQAARAFGGDNRETEEMNAQLRQAYGMLVAENCPGLWYLQGGELLGDDGEGTVDGTHPTDLGFSRMAAMTGPVVADMLARPAAGAKP